MALARTAVLGCFFVSGATGLIYEVSWMRMLILVFGSTTFAVSTIVAIFMGGLALGSFLAGRFIDRRGPPLLMYGVLEALIGLYALATPWLFGSLLSLYPRLFASSTPSYTALSLVRLIFSAGVLLLPTTLMGATLPILARYVTGSVARIGLSVGGLYGINTLGATIGTFLAGFYLLPILGTQKTIALTAAVNIVLGVGVLAFQWQRAEPASRLAAKAAEATGGESRQPVGLYSRAQVAVVLAAFALAGLAAMIYEVAWTRALALIIGNSVYAFSIMLVTFLAGLAAGSLIAALLAERLRIESLSLLGTAQGLIAATALLTLSLFGDLPYVFTMTLKGFYWSNRLLFLLNFLICFAVMFVPTLFMGAFFPLVVKALATSLERLGRWVGDIYSINTLGTIMGALLTGFLLIPVLGIQGSLLAAAALNLGLALLLIGISNRTRPARALLSVTSILVVASMYAVLPGWDPLVMAGGVYVNATTFEGNTREEFRHWLTADRTLLYHRTGISTTVTVAEEKGGNVYLATNGKVEASSHGDMPTQVLLAQLPLLMHGDPQDVLVIGFGSGTTIGSAMRHPVRRAVVVELEAAVLEGSQFFNNVNNRPLQDPRLNVVTDDGRNYLLRTTGTFDVIISEPSNPWITGVASLFTKDFFELGRRRLKREGIFAQWVSLYGLSSGNLRSVVKTFHAVFPHVLVFETLRATDLVLLGSSDPIVMDLTAIRTKLGRTAIAADLARVEIPDPYHLLALFRFGNEEIREFAGRARLNTDDNMLIEFSAPLSLHAETATTNSFLITMAWRRINPYMPDLGATPRERVQFYLRLGRACFDRKDILQARRYVREAVDEIRKSGLPRSEASLKD